MFNFHPMDSLLPHVPKMKPFDYGTTQLKEAQLSSKLTLLQSEVYNSHAMDNCQLVQVMINQSKYGLLTIANFNMDFNIPIGLEVLSSHKMSDLLHLEVMIDLLSFGIVNRGKNHSDITNTLELFIKFNFHQIQLSQALAHMIKNSNYLMSGPRESYNIMMHMQTQYQI